MVNKNAVGDHLPLHQLHRQPGVPLHPDALWQFVPVREIFYKICLIIIFNSKSIKNRKNQ